MRRSEGKKIEYERCIYCKEKKFIYRRKDGENERCECREVGKVGSRGGGGVGGERERGREGRGMNSPQTLFRIDSLTTDKGLCIV